MSTSLQQRLNATNASSLNNLVEGFNYDRTQLAVGIVHLGIGAFHRAHQADYTHTYINNTGDLKWGIVGVSLRSASVAEQLNPQNGLYTLVEQSSNQHKYKLVGNVKKVLVAPHDPEAVIALMAKEDTKIVSLTVTEKGYCHDPASGTLNLAHPDIQHDLANLKSPVSAIGFIVAALKRRFDNKLPPFTPLTCDNLPENGKVLSGLVIEFAKKVDQKLASWITDKVSFPCTMVDRIVPATQAEDIETLAQQIGVNDLAMVKAEPFKQWVIEDSFCNARPKWELVGATVVNDVSKFEEMKLRLLNGSHSSIAYIGFLSGYEYVADVMSDSSLRSFIEGLMNEEITPAVDLPEEIDITTYKSQLISRFENTALKHKTYQIAMDGSQKLPQRLLNTLRYLLTNSLNYYRITFVLSTWMHYVSGKARQQQSYIVQDPLAQDFLRIHKLADSQKIVNEFLSIKSIFGQDLIRNEQLVLLLVTYFDAIKLNGVQKCISTLPELTNDA